jgi:glutaminyl-peptide cyclotransferase
MHTTGTRRPDRRAAWHVRATAVVASCLLSMVAVGCGDDDTPSVASAPPAVDAAPTTIGDAPAAPTAAPTTDPTISDASGTDTAPIDTAPIDTVTTTGPCQVRYEIVSTRPHDPTAFTQGLIVDGDVLHESTGLYGQSTVRTVDPDTGEVLRSTPLPAEHFGEGLTLFDGLLYQLTWREGVVHVYDRSLTRVDTRAWAGEGWGLTTDDTALVLSDGSSTLFWIDPATWTPTRTITVTDAGRPVSLLNELEWVDGAVLANVWMSPLVVIVDPTSGEVTGQLDLTALLPDPATLTDPRDDVLNGVALDPSTGHLLVTGKRWPTLYELDVDRTCWPAGSDAAP